MDRWMDGWSVDESNSSKGGNELKTNERPDPF